ncbi:MAG TPA: sigma-70 family RNA polymerase sigma factor [Azospirillaceae bacterium]|nr:sigma-70 family RNA polymerase sigma factor [Azospirillaceae bacterium]
MEATNKTIMKRDPDTLAQLEKEIPSLRRFARALVGDAVRADDLVQDALERALTRLDTFQPGTNMRAWLFTILRNAFINDLRRARLTPTSPDTIEGMMAPAPASQDHGIALGDLRRALDRLSPEMREVVLLIGLEGLSYEEAAEILKVKVGTVKSRLSRGREALRKLLDGEVHMGGVGRERPKLAASAEPLATLILQFRRDETRKGLPGPAPKQDILRRRIAI